MSKVAAVRRFARDRKMLAITVLIVCLVVVGTVRYRTAPGTKPEGVDSAHSTQFTRALHTLGNPDAPVRVTVFTDFECPYCKAFHETFLPALRSKYGAQVSISYKNFPRRQHPGAHIKAEAAECVSMIDGEVAYWKYVEKLFATEPVEFTNDAPDAIYTDAKAIGIDSAAVRACIEKKQTAAIVDGDFAEGRAMGAAVTPSVRIEGANQSIMIQGNRGSGTYASIDYILALLKK